MQSYGYCELGGNKPTTRIVLVQSLMKLSIRGPTLVVIEYTEVLAVTNNAYQSVPPQWVT